MEASLDKRWDLFLQEATSLERLLLQVCEEEVLLME